MGTDIHLSVEHLKRGEWVRAEPQIPNRWYDPKYPDEPGFVHEEWFGQRNYNLFAVLADVRNGRGFAGIETGERLNVIAEPRGLPYGSTVDPDEVEHTPSWLSLRELLDFDWWQTSRHYGVVDARNYRQWKVYGKPRGWSGEVFGGLTKIISNEEMEKLVGDTWPRDEEKYRHVFTRVSWVEPYAEAIGGEWFKFLVRLIRLCKTENDGNMDAVRIVFYFDS